MTVHRAAQSGFEADADRYQRGRPDYPADVDRWLRNDLRLGAGKSVVDLGAGTGKFTPRLLATGAAVIAVEPVAAMRSKLAAGLPEVDLREGSAEAIPLADRSVNAVVCAQAFHWFATRAAVSEMHRVLKPGGRLGLIWNTRDDSVGWVKRAFAVIEPYEGGAPRFQSGAWRDVFPAPGFGPLHEERFVHVHAGPPERVIVDRLLSVSFVASLAAEERSVVAERLRKVIRDSEVGGQAEIAVPYWTYAYWAERL